MFQNFPEDNKNDDFLDDFRQKIANQTLDDLEEKRGEMKHSKNVFIGAVSGMALAFVVGWIVLSPRYEDSNSPEIPVVRRQQAPVKVQPVEPGGMDIQDQDKSVYNIVEKKSEDEHTVENLLPPPEEPKAPENIQTDVMSEQKTPETEPAVKAAPEPAAPAVAAVETPAPTPAAPATKPLDTAAEQAKKKAEIARQLNSITSEEAAATPAAVPSGKAAGGDINNIIKVQESIQNKSAKYSDKVLSNNMESKTIDKVDSTPPSEFDSEFDEPAAAPAKKAATAAATPAPAGVWQLQLMASQDKAGAESSFAQMAKKYPMLASLPHEIETADLGAKGTFYRLKAGAFQNKADADSACKKLQASGGTCIVKKK